MHSGIITILPIVNILAIIFLLEDGLMIEIKALNKWAIISSLLVVASWHYYRIYSKKGVTRLIKEWDETDFNKKRKFSFWMKTYVAITVALLVISLLF